MKERGLSLAVFADWYNTDVIEFVRFFDENTQEWWTPETGCGKQERERYRER